MEFTVEEMNLIGIFDTSGRQKLIVQMSESLPHVDEPELRQMIEILIVRLKNISDEEFSKIVFIADYDDFDEMEV